MSWGTITASTIACILAVLLIFSCLQYQVLSSDYMNLYNSYHHLKGEYDQLKANYMDLYGRYGSLKDRYEGLQEDYRKALSRLKVVSEENSKLKENYSRLTDSYEKLKLQLDEIKRRYEELEKKYGDLMSKCSEMEVSLPRIKGGLKEISDRILTPSDRIPDMLRQASPAMVEDVVYGELGLRAETPPEAKAKKVLEWIMLNLEYLDDDFHQYLTDHELRSHQDFLSLPNETLARGGGDCEDLATLTYTMLKAVLGEDEQIYIVYICDGTCHVATIYKHGDKIMVLDPAGAYVTDARMLLEMSMNRGLNKYMVWLNPLAIRREGKEFLMEKGFAELVYMKAPGIVGKAYKFMKAEDAVALWLNNWREEMVNPSIRMVANDTFVKVFTSTQEFLDWMEKSA